MDEQNITLCEEMMRIQIDFFESVGMREMVERSAGILEDYRKGIGKRDEKYCI